MTPSPPRLANVSDLLIHVASLPPAEREAARARIHAALELPSRAARAALGLLALDLAVPAPGAAGHVLVLPATTHVATHATTHAPGAVPAWQRASA